MTSNDSKENMDLPKSLQDRAERYAIEQFDNDAKKITRNMEGEIECVKILVTEA